MPAPKGRQGYTQSSLAIPAFNPKSGPYGGGRPGDLLLRGLGADMGQGQAVGRWGGCEPEETVCGVPALKVLCFVFLGQRYPFSPCLPGPCLPGPCLPGPAGAPPCGYGLVQMIVVCAMRQNPMCLVGAGVGVFQGSPLPLLVLMPVPELHPSPHNSIPPSNLPARGVTPCSFFNPGYYPGSWPERDSAFPSLIPLPPRCHGLGRKGSS